MTDYILLITACAAVSLVITLKRAKALGGIFKSAAAGLAGLVALAFSPISAAVAINPFTLAVSLFFGLPGVASLMALRVICMI